MSPPQVRAYAQGCENGHTWLKITSTGAPDGVCPYCGSEKTIASQSWTLQLPRQEGRDE